MFWIASASGNTFAYAWRGDLPASARGGELARRLCARGRGLGLDGLFVLDQPGEGAWRLEHWDADGSHSFCSNGTRAALAVPGSPGAERVSCLSNGQRIEMARTDSGVSLRMPEGSGFGLRPVVLRERRPHAYGWIGNPQLVVEAEDLQGLDLAGEAKPLRHDPAFEAGTNVNFIRLLEPGRLQIRSWERGVEGETLCCGTGCAVAGAWMIRRTGLPVWTLETAGGDPVTVRAVLDEDGGWRDLWLSGPVRLLGDFRPADTFAW